MKIYFGFTMAGDRSAVETARRMVAVLEEMGHRVLTRHLVEEGAREADLRLGAGAVYERDMAWLAECDALVAEVSGSSFGLGFEAGYLLGGTDKPVLLFYRREAAPRISLLITGNRHTRCTLAAYTDAAEAEECLRRTGFLTGACP